MSEFGEIKELMRDAAQTASLPTSMSEQMRRKVTLRRARTIGIAVLLSVAVVSGGFQVMQATTFDQSAPNETADDGDLSGGHVTNMVDESIQNARPAAVAPSVPYLLDLDTQRMTPLPDDITSIWSNSDHASFAMASDGRLAFVGKGDEGPAIFVARLDGTGIRQVTQGSTPVANPAWSPDGTKIAYDGWRGDSTQLFLIDVATGEVRSGNWETPDITCPLCAHMPQFTPDGSSIIYTVGGSAPVVRIAPWDGRDARTFLGAEAGLTDAGNASISPDGSAVTYLAGGYPQGVDEFSHCGPCRLLADADGGNKRIINGGVAVPAGAWSPDSTRLALKNDRFLKAETIRVIDVSTGETTTVADGHTAVWVDAHTLLVGRR